MKDKKVLIYAGTTEGRKLVSYLGRRGVRLHVCVATAYGESLLPEEDSLHKQLPHIHAVSHRVFQDMIPVFFLLLCLHRLELFYLSYTISPWCYHFSANYFCLSVPDEYCREHIYLCVCQFFQSQDLHLFSFSCNVLYNAAHSFF